ncbi:MAG: hypothetical protein ACLS3P_12665 [Agathobacter sp.]|uniref:hypothetical protein n=1 Tax=Agathobacter sp. TaxID=2021311 RepID=UPI003993EDC2
MKKKLAAILAGLLVLTMGTTVFAQTDGSPSVDSKAQEAEKYKQNISSIEISSGTVSVKAADPKVMDEAKAEAAKAGTVDNVLAMADVHPSVEDASSGLTVKFYISGVSKGDNVYALHQKADGTWEVCNTVVGNGYVKVTLYSFSTIAIVKYDDGAVVTPTQQINPKDDTDNGNTTNNTTNTTTNNTTNTTTGDTGNTNSTTTNTTGDTNNNGGSTSTTNNNPVDNSVGNTTNSTTYNTTNNTTNNTIGNAAASDNNGAAAGGAAVTRTSAGSSGVATSPKTGSGIPAIPVIALLALMSIAVCTKKAHSL